MNRKSNFMKFLMKTKTTLRKRQKKPKNYDMRMKLKDISNDRLIESKIVNEFNRKS